MADQYETEFNLTAGPNKFDLMLALFENRDGSHHVKFTIEQRVPGTAKSVPGTKQVVEVCISSIEREDGSAESWNIRGWMTGGNFKCYYSTKNRTGWFARLKKP